MAFMWYGRTGFLLKGHLIQSENPDHDAMAQTAQAALIASAFARDQEMKGKWDRIYAVTAFYVGTSDDLGPYEYLEAIKCVFGNSFSPADLNDEGTEGLKLKLAEYRSPRIYGGSGDCEIPSPMPLSRLISALKIRRDSDLWASGLSPIHTCFQISSGLTRVPIKGRPTTFHTGFC